MDTDKTITAQFSTFENTTYYVDYENGDDSRDGTSIDTSWKHAPGDPSAQENPLLIELEPGNRILFKGNTIYRGQVSIKSSGSSKHPILYIGDSWPRLDGEKAIIDGGEPVTGWTQCTSAAECNNNSNYTNIYYAYLSGDIDPLSLNLHEYDSVNQEDDFLWMAQDPKPSDSYFFE